MAPAAKRMEKGSYRTYEAQARLLAAVVAAMPDNFRFDYKTIASYLGGKSTESAVEHRFRPLKVQARVLRLMVAKGIDPMDHPVFEWRTESEIQKYFGESTWEGIAYQFRAIKRTADTLKAAADNGGDPVQAFQALLDNGTIPRANIVVHTPLAPTPTPKKTRPAPSGSVTPAAKRRKAAAVIEPESEDGAEDQPDIEDNAEAEPETKGEAEANAGLDSDGSLYQCSSSDSDDDDGLNDTPTKPKSVPRQTRSAQKKGSGPSVPAQAAAAAPAMASKQAASASTPSKAAQTGATKSTPVKQHPIAPAPTGAANPTPSQPLPIAPRPAVSAPTSTSTGPAPSFSVPARPVQRPVPNDFTNPATGLPYHVTPARTATTTAATSISIPAPAPSTAGAVNPSPTDTSSTGTFRRTSVVSIGSSSGATYATGPNPYLSGGLLPDLINQQGLVNQIPLFHPNGGDLLVNQQGLVGAGQDNNILQARIQLQNLMIMNLLNNSNNSNLPAVIPAIGQQQSFMSAPAIPNYLANPPISTNAFSTEVPTTTAGSGARSTTTTMNTPTTMLNTSAPTATGISPFTNTASATAFAGSAFAGAGKVDDFAAFLNFGGDGEEDAGDV
ncbi:hypothetical protein VTJ04DRAFT_6267 [Mycothermus thermophilus]|uniref:uncharacterized protein n=1 Tax=Humicola insolens TaxID=85995 RepID=UPI0037449684